MIASTARFLFAALLTIAVAGCGGGDDPAPVVDTPIEVDAPDRTEVETTTDDTNNAEVERYCEAVDEYVTEARKLTDDPANADVDRITELATDLGDRSVTLGAALAGDANATERFHDCTNLFANIGD